MMKDYLFFSSPEINVLHKQASEISVAWIEEEFQTLSLFGGGESFVIHQAQDMKSDVFEAIQSLELSDRFLVLAFETENQTWKKLIKENRVPTLVIEAPRFWEINKLLDFVASYLRLPLSFESKNWILDSIENDLSSFYNTCTVLKLNYPESREIKIDEVKSLFTLDRLDQFSMASSFARKKFDVFFDRLTQLEGDFEKMRQFFNFMQSHLIKMADTSYLGKKPRLTQYDKDLQGTAKLWSTDDLNREIRRFSSWEILSKKKDHSLWHELKKSYLASLHKSFP
jgi:DNA polymerase III delta subunit